MTFLERYEDAERPLAAKVCLDLAIFHIDLAYARMNNLIRAYPNEGIDAKEVQDFVPDMATAERILRMAVDLSEPCEWPWDSDDFTDFWELGGDVNEFRSMTEYMKRMPEFYRAFVDAHSMPSDYGQALLDGIPKWRN